MGVCIVTQAPGRVWAFPAAAAGGVRQVRGEMLGVRGQRWELGALGPPVGLNCGFIEGERAGSSPLWLTAHLGGGEVGEKMDF